MYLCEVARRSREREKPATVGPHTHTYVEDIWDMEKEVREERRWMELLDCSEMLLTVCDCVLCVVVGGQPVV